MGKIKMGGSATMEFDPDYYEISIEITITDKTAGIAISKGRQLIEDLLTTLNKQLDIKPNNMTVSHEKTRICYGDEESFEFYKKLRMITNVDHRTTESIINVLQGFNYIEYDIDPLLENLNQKEKLVINAAVEDSRNKAEMIISSLNCSIIGFEEIQHDYKTDYYTLSVCHKIGSVEPSDSQAAKLSNRKISITKNVNVIWLTD